MPSLTVGLSMEHNTAVLVWASGCYWIVCVFGVFHDCFHCNWEHEAEADEAFDLDWDASGLLLLLVAMAIVYRSSDRIHSCVGTFLKVFIVINEWFALKKSQVKNISQVNSFDDVRAGRLSVALFFWAWTILKEVIINATWPGSKSLLFCPMTFLARSGPAPCLLPAFTQHRSPRST